MALKPDPNEWGEAVHVFEEVECEGCHETIDLSEADSVNEGIQLFNEHVRKHHPENI